LDPKRTIYARTIRNIFLILTVIGLVLGLIVFIILYATGYYWLYAIQIMISVYIACIPEILPAIIQVGKKTNMRLINESKKIFFFSYV
jgi:magnesium-transporting ATPase (P-type)